MESKCDYYYKVSTEEGFKYYGMKILTEDTYYIDEILDQINKTNGIFIGKEEFDDNIKTPMELDVMDSDTELHKIATIIFETINLDCLTEGNKIII